MRTSYYKSQTGGKESRTATPKAMGESDTESRKKREIVTDGRSNPISPKRRMLSIEDVPLSIRGEGGKAASELPVWLGDAVPSVIQQLKRDRREKGGIV